MPASPLEPTAADATASDVERAAALRRMKTLATGLLVAAAIVFVVARRFDDRGWVGYVVAFAEAAMVGALADWFAVTALFRHPLRLPIPHTAIIPRRKEQIGASLGEFVETNFLGHEVVGERLARAGVGRRLGDWLAHPANARRAAAAGADALHGVLDVLDDREISASVESMVERRIRQVAVAPLLGRAIDLGLEGRHHEPLLDGILTGLQGFLDDNRATLRAQLARESPWWVPEPIDDRLFAKIFDGAHRFLGDLRADRDHAVRRSIDERLVALAGRLRDDPALVTRGEQLKDELLAHPEVRAWIASLWGEIKASMSRAATDPDSELHRRAAFSLGRLGERIQAEPDLQAKIDRWVASAVGYVIDNYRGEVSALISSTVARWDAESTSRRLELQVGRDLQFIRINGTIVGGLAGLLIHALGELL